MADKIYTQKSGGIFTKKQLLQMRQAGVNFYSTAPDGQKRGIHNEVAIALNKDSDQYRKLQSLEEFESVTSQTNYAVVLTENSRLIIFDDDTNTKVKISKESALCTYRQKNNKKSLHYFLIAKTDKDVERFAAMDNKIKGFEVFTFHRNNVLCVQGSFRVSNENSEPKSSWCLNGGDLQKLKDVPITSFEDVAKNIPQWASVHNNSNARNNRISAEMQSANVLVGQRHTSCLSVTLNFLFSMKVDVSDIGFTMETWNNKLPRPLPKDELDTIIKDAISYYSKNKDDTTEREIKSFIRKKYEDTVELENLLDIEKPELRDKLVCVDAIISSNNISYSIPTEISVECLNDSESHIKNCPKASVISVEDVDKPSFTEINDRQKTQLLKQIAQKNAPYSMIDELRNY